jgi:hypothetical protein
MAEGFNAKIALTLVIPSGLELFPPRRRRSGVESVVPPVNCLLTRPVSASAQGPADGRPEDAAPGSAVCRGFPGHPAD